MTYVQGNSKDYVFESCPIKEGGETFIEDYGNISDEGFIELLYHYWKPASGDEKFKKHLLERLAKRLGVKLRKKALTEDEHDKEFLTLINGHEKILKEMGK